MKKKQQFYQLIISVALCWVGVLVIWMLVQGQDHAIFLLCLLITSGLLTLQSLFTVITMLYAWNDQYTLSAHRSPQTFVEPTISFSALIPARNEYRVIADTIRAIDAIDYPSHLKEIIVICRFDDTATVQAAIHKALRGVSSSSLKLISSHTNLSNKPASLNVGLQDASRDVVVVFDAEDEPHPDIYHIVNTEMMRHHSDVVQSGVQLMDYRSSWYATMNILEYYFWFKSALLCFSHLGVVPLAGNTVFVKRNLLEDINGWDEQMLTEDADIGIRLSAAGAKTKVLYDERHVTREETPATLNGFMKQRTRWNQGFLQLLLKGNFLHLPTLRAKLLTGYVLITPQLQALWLLYLPLSLILIFFMKIPVGLALLSLAPVYVLILQFFLYNVGLWEFTHDFNLFYPLWMPIKMLVTFFPFQMILGISSARATMRFFRRQFSWEKTEHFNNHREVVLAEIKA